MTKATENKADFLRLLELFDLGRGLKSTREKIDAAEIMSPTLLSLISDSRGQMLSLQKELLGMRERLGSQGNSIARHMLSLCVEMGFIVSLSQKACDRAVPNAEKFVVKIQEKTGWNK